MIKTIVPLSKERPVELAADELARCLGMLLNCAPTVMHAAETSNASIRLGRFGDLSELHGEQSLVPDARDDAYRIEVGPTGGFIAGSNSRSVLLGTYRYLTELGFRWIRPGPDGEFVPALEPPLPTVRLQETASYRHRGVCIEGAVSRENVLDMVEWLPKLGFNAYFIQFREAFNFYQRWYEHVGNPTLPAERFTVEDARGLTAELRQSIKTRGLDLHMVGHGWTCEPFGIPGTGWFQHEGPLPKDAIPHLAEVKGKRDLWGGIALNTNLCYGNPDTRRIITQAILQWAEANRDVDIIHFWLADGSNNQCECPLCKDTRPADFYVDMLNDVDRMLENANLETRIVFLVYVDLLWAPEKERLRNPDRFILMFAPITRSYSTAFAPDAAVGAKALPPYTRNTLTFPKEPELNVAFLRAWQEQFDGDSFDFDYHFMWDHHKDPGQFEMAKVLHEDCVRLKDLGLNGLVSCQNQRVFFPTGLGMTVMGQTLWNRNRSFDDIADDALEHAFGPRYPEVKTYLRQLSEWFDPVLLRGERDRETQASAPAKLREARACIRNMRPTIEQECRTAVRCQAVSWKYLDAHAEFADLFAQALEARFAGRDDLAKDQCHKLFEWTRANELRLQPVFDVLEFQLTVAPLFGISRAEIQ